MIEETVVAASSAAAAQPEFKQFDGWDEEGNPVVTKKADSPKEKPAASPAADTSKETKTEDAADSAAKKTQEKNRRPDVEDRFKKLTNDHKAEVERLRRELEEARKPKETKAESSPARQTETKSAEPQPTRPKPNLDDKLPDGKPKYPKYEDYIEDRSDWKVEQELARLEREQTVAKQREAMNSQLTEARTRYTDFDSVTKPLVADLLKPDVPREVFAVINDSPVLPDLLYAIGGSETTKADFLDACRTNPGKALRVALLMEQEIAKELGKGKAAASKGATVEEQTSPATPKPRAPKPPAEVGGRGTSEEDGSISAAKAGNFRAFEAEQTRRALASRR